MGDVRNEAIEAVDETKSEVERLWAVIYRRDEEHQKSIAAEEEARAEVRRLMLAMDISQRVLERERKRGQALEQRIARLCDSSEELFAAQARVATEAKRCLAAATKAALAAARCEDPEEAMGHISDAQGELDIARGVLVGLVGVRRATLLRAWTLVSRYVEKRSPVEIHVIVRPEAA